MDRRAEPEVPVAQVTVAARGKHGATYRVRTGTQEAVVAVATMSGMGGAEDAVWCVTDYSSRCIHTDHVRRFIVEENQ